MMIRVLLVLGILVTAAAGVARSDRQEAVPLRQSFAVFPMQLDDWRGMPQPPLDDKVLDVLGVDDYLTRAYFDQSRAGVGLYIGYWQSQRQGDTIHSPQNCLPGAGWEPVANRILTTKDPRDPGRSEIGLNRYLIQKGLDRQLVLYWYQSHDRVVASEYWSKIYLVLDALRMNRSDGALVRVITPITGQSPADEAAAEQRAVRFVESLLPRLSTFLPS